MRARFIVASSLIWLVAGLGLADDLCGKWTEVDRSRGIVVSRRDQPGLGLPAFRGQGRIHGGVLQVLAVMLDVNEVGAWAFGVDKSHLLKRIDARTDLIYLYSDIPWPIRDRDMIVAAEVDVIKPGQEFRITLRSVPDAVPERKDRIRVHVCSSTFHLTKVDAETTEIDYEMSLDPAGHLPNWVSAYVAKTVPFKTLVAIEERAAESRGRYEAVVRKWSAAM